MLYEGGLWRQNIEMNGVVGAQNLCQVCKVLAYGNSLK